ncbi:sensor histidine kinase [Chamaesiphon minutus]|uniref:histidine kinase n=1 Tax=Chamaesiphon minutus (strain ATCC 27169 / PCC 6605) TaxID=1173020 RepID=K9UIM8_CHAP6|nr:HAMP domain-containing sensor histidine kinase [Chamaesiphon minutus]AFY94967.1 histidine kinase [Chamaesiphon minutus PCC 6605]
MENPPPPELSLGDLKDELIAHLMQELCTPLTNIKTALKLLESPVLKQPQRQRYLGLIRGECDRQNSLINGATRLLALDRSPDRAGVVPLQLAQIVPGVVSTYQPLAAEKGVRLGYTIPSNLPPILCVETWVRQIAIDLLHNGIKYTADGGQVFVQASVQGEYVQLEFRDTGIGIAPAEIPKIFDRFYRVRHLPDEHNNGAGLGLTIVQNILLRCGGSISVISQVGVGSKFRVLLPTGG